MNVYKTSDLLIKNLFVISLNENLSAGLRWDIGSSTRENYNPGKQKLCSVSFARLNEEVRKQNLWFGNIWKEYLEDNCIEGRDNSTNY